MTHGFLETFKTCISHAFDSCVDFSLLAPPSANGAPVVKWFRDPIPPQRSGNHQMPGLPNGHQSETQSYLIGKPLGSTHKGCTAVHPNGHLPENWRYPKLPQDKWKLWSHSHSFWVRYLDMSDPQRACWWPMRPRGSRQEDVLNVSLIETFIGSKAIAFNKVKLFPIIMHGGGTDHPTPRIVGGNPFRQSHTL